MAVASFPAIHVTGPVHHYIRLPCHDSEIYYLGTAEVTPQIELQRMRKDVFNDLGGRMVPFQRTNQGQIGALAIMFNRFSKSAVALIRTGCSIGESGLAFEDGWETRHARGSLVFGQTTIELWQVFDNFGTAFATPGLEIGWYWPVVDVEKLGSPTIGTEDEKLLFVATAFPYWTAPASLHSVQSTDRSFQLYSKNPLLFPAAVLVPQ